MYHKRRRRRRASSTKKSSPGRKKATSTSETQKANEHEAHADADADQMIMIQSPTAIEITTKQDRDRQNEGKGNESTVVGAVAVTEPLTLTTDAHAKVSDSSAGVAVPVSVLSPASSSSDKDNVISSTTGSGSGSGPVQEQYGAGTGAVTGAAVSANACMPGQQNQIKAVGARKRKSTPMLKIENKTRISSSNGMMTPLSDNEDDEDDEDEEDEDEDEVEFGGRRNRNGMIHIHAILSELKTAKSGIQGNNAATASLASPSKEVIARAREAQAQAQDAEDEDKVVDIGGNDRADCGTKSQAHNNRIGEDAPVESGARLLRARTAFGAALVGQRSGSGSDPSASASSLSIVQAQAPRRGRKPKQISSTTKFVKSQRPSANNRVGSRRSHSHSRRRGDNEDRDEDEDDDHESYSDEDHDNDEMEQEDDLHNNNVALSGEQGHGRGQGHGHGQGHGSSDGAGADGEQSCNLCAYTCPDKSTMLRHMRKHSGERPFQCRLCGFGFTTKANCERHLKNRHGQVDRDQVRRQIECHLVTTSSMDGSGSGGSSNDEASGHSPQLRQSQSQTQKHQQQRQQYGQGQGEDSAPSTLKSGAFSVKHMLSNTNTKPQLNSNASATAAAGLFTPTGIANPGSNSLFLPPVSVNAAAVFANEYLQAAAAAKSPYMLNNLHPMFLGGAGGVSPAAAAAAMEFPGLTIANAHSGSPSAAGNVSANANANTKRNIFLESMARGHPLFGGGAGAFEQLKSASANQQQAALPLLTTNHGGGAGGAVPANNGPLDLSMDAMDLSVKRERGGSSAQISAALNANASSLLKPKALYPSDNLSTGLITSPYVSKREPIVHPQLPLNFSAHGGVGSAAADLNTLGPSAAGAGGAVSGLGAGVGVPFPLFPFGAGNPHMNAAGFPFGLRAPSEMDKFIGMSLAAGAGGPTPSKNHSIPFLAASSSSSTIGSIATSTNANNFAGSSMEIVADRDRNGNDHPSAGSDLSGRRRASLSSSNSVSVSVPRPASYKSSSASPNPAVSSSRHGNSGGGHKRTEKRRGAGGEYQKPKQRRYRTERPFSCPHCPAKFTLRSNMERHGKHQHPNVWQRSPSNRVINRQKNMANQQGHGHGGGSGASSLIGSPTLVPSNKFSAMNGFEYSHSAAKLLAGAAAAGAGGLKHGKASAAGLEGLPTNTAGNVNVRAVIAQQLKRKMSGTNLRMQEEDAVASGSGSEEEDVDMEDDHDTDVKGGIINSKDTDVATPDLASVSQLLNRAKSSNFAEYFTQSAEANNSNNNENRSGSGSRSASAGGGGSETESDDNRSRSSSDEHEHDEDGDGDDGPDGDGDQDEDDEENEDERDEEQGRGLVGAGERERKRYKLANGEKKKSAYSSAPHKISCPHCTRRFPWTSSLRRHLLTHTGQKPYQCSKCPLLFTTKSNCDRHLVRKHNAKRERDRELLLANGGGGGVGSGTEGGGPEPPIVIRAGKRGRRKGKRTAMPTKATGLSAGVDAPAPVDDLQLEDHGTGLDAEEAGQTSRASTPVTVAITTPRPGRPPKNKPQPATEFLCITPKNASAAAAALNSSVSASSNGLASNSSSPGEDVAFRCHLCDASAVERDILLAHMEEDHKETFHLLLAKGALVSSPPSPPTDTSESEVTPPGSGGAPGAASTSTGDQKDVTNRKVMCVFCVRRFWSVEDLRRHIRSHSGERPFSCPYCSRRFTLKHSMLRHIKKHENSAAASASLAGLNNNNELTITPILPSKTVGGKFGKRIRIGSKHAQTPSLNQATPSSTANFEVGSANSDLIGKLLGINDESLVEELLSKSDAKGAAELLGVGVTSTTSAAVVSSSTN